MYNVKKVLSENFNKLPEDIKEAILSVDFGKNIRAIAQKYRLHIDQTSKLSDESILLMLGLTYPENFTTNLQDNVEIEEDQAREIAKEVNEQIFLPIRESLKKIYNDSESVDLEPSTADDQLQSTNDNDLKREDVLKVLEEPESLEPLSPKLPNADHTQTTTDNNNSKPPNANPPQPATEPPSTADDSLPTAPKEQHTLIVPPKADFVEQNLKKPINIPPSETKIEAPDKSSYKVDPYRESIE